LPLFEDSFPGMIAAKAARMKCVVVPHHSQVKEERWAAADLKLSSLQNFGVLHFKPVAVTVLIFIYNQLCLS
jgi:sugar-phosphatase